MNGVLRDKQGSRKMERGVKNSTKMTGFSKLYEKNRNFVRILTIAGGATRSSFITRVTETR